MPTSCEGKSECVIVRIKGKNTAMAFGRNPAALASQGHFKAHCHMRQHDSETMGDSQEGALKCGMAR